MQRIVGKDVIDIFEIVTTDSQIVRNQLLSIHVFASINAKQW